MSDRWVSQGRRFCKFCNCWFADNKISIENHERGASHQANVESDLSKTFKNKQDLAAAERAFAAEMQRIEATAMKSFEEDARRDPFARDEMERVIQARAKAASASRR
uniref:WW domain-binding protein 4 n=1 Tax=Aceria tosichella TaxID=561515 RepID=A0A6G1S5V9_9ACAR